MTAQEWLAAFAAGLGDGLEAPDEATFDRLLEVAAVAAHASERVAAPVACWLVGATGTDVDRALAVARAVEAGQGQTGQGQEAGGQEAGGWPTS